MAKSVKSVQIVATFVSAGVAQGAGGFIIVGGKIKKIPPRGPLFKQLTEVVEKIAAGR